MRKLSNDELKIIKNIQKSINGVKIPVAIYARKSSISEIDKQKTDIEASIETQINECSYMISQYVDILELKEVYYEEDTTGRFLVDRKEFNKLLKEVENNTIKIIFVSKWDRLARSVPDHNTILQVVLEHKALVVVIEDTGEKNAASTLYQGIFAVINQYYVDKIAEDTKATLIHKTKQGLSGGGVANYGYKYENKRLVIEPQEAKIVRDIYNKFDSGMSLDSVVEDLNFRNIKTRKGKKFSKSTIRDILTNVKYMGTYRYNRQDRKQSKIIQKDFEEVLVEDGIKKPIITKTLFESVQKRFQTKQAKPTFNYHLTGKIKCGVCGAGMVGSSQSGGSGKPRIKYYICENYLAKKGKTCTNKGIKAEPIEKQVKELIIDIINKYIKTDLFNTNELNQYLVGHKATKKKLNKTLDNIKAKIDENLEAYTDISTDDDIKALLKEALPKLKNEKEVLEDKINTVNQVIEKYESIIQHKNIETLTKDELFNNEATTQKLIELMLDKFIIDDTFEIKILDK
jgi:site-specific DNA recombinase